MGEGSAGSMKAEMAMTEVMVVIYRVPTSSGP